MENLGQARPVSAVPLLTALLQRQQVYACFVHFQKAYDSAWPNGMFHKLKSMALSHTPDSEHILKIAMCSKNKQSLYEVFHFHKKDYIRDAHTT